MQSLRGRNELRKQKSSPLPTRPCSMTSEAWFLGYIGQREIYKWVSIQYEAPLLPVKGIPRKASGNMQLRSLILPIILSAMTCMSAPTPSPNNEIGESPAFLILEIRGQSLMLYSIRREGSKSSSRTCDAG